MSTHNIGFYEDLTKIIYIFVLSSNTQLISSADLDIVDYVRFWPSTDQGSDSPLCST